MHIVIAKVDEVFFDGQAVSLTAPGTDGELTVLPGHMSLITTLKAGTIRVRETPGAAPQHFTIHGGVMEVRHDGATVLL